MPDVDQPPQKGATLTPPGEAAPTTVHYSPASDFVGVVQKGLVASLPLVARGAVKLIPAARREQAVSFALARVIPLAISTIAASGTTGSTIALTRGGNLLQEVKKGLLQRIALWFVPDEVTEIVSSLQQEVTRLGNERLSTDAWALGIADGEVQLAVRDKSRIRESAETVADVFFDSFETLKQYRAKMSSWVKR